MDKTKIETLVTACFSRCPFCFAEGSIEFEWGHSIPKQITCLGCGAKWELLLGLNKDWTFLGAKLVDTGSTKKGIISEEEEIFIITIGEENEEFVELEETSEEPYENYELLQL